MGSGKIRDEHRQTLEWLNRHTDNEIGFFGVAVEVLRTNSSPPAVNFKPVVFPNEWQRGVRQSAETGGRYEAYRAYFQLLLDELREKHRFTNARVGQPQNWYTFRSGVPGADYGTSFAQGGRVRAELYIDFEDSEINKAFFDRLYGQRKEFEEAFGEVLSWERLDERRASRIAIYRPGSIDASTEELKRIRDWAIEKLLKFRTVFGPKLRDHVQASAGAGAA